MKQIAQEVLLNEAQTLIDSSHTLDFGEFERIVECIFNTRGKLIVMGVGKSGHIGAKIAATLASTGTPSFFIHPTEALHGDLGMIQQEDSILAISYSGESDELKAVLPHIKKRGIKIITMSKDKQSSISQMGDYFLSIAIKREACPLNIAPTSSTTLTLALGDVLSACLIKKRNFTHFDFASFHPGGSLGKRLFVQVKDLMQTTNLPLISPQTLLQDAIITMSEARLGSAIIVENDRVLGILSDGDLRRAMLREDFELKKEVMFYATNNPKLCNDASLLAFDALKLMEKHKIQCLIITDDMQKIQGVLHLHTLITAGIQ
ncbi:hypothetical protein BBW65_04815 [Helicobacter enhydrae]|uniref:KpsF/GutQ family sugar-phosphate isomerase n=1 Tax=Helicobacter enhydrae TaxID=222136 RepID=A0A1B1U632_9HELI|nr:KpsF/GutQ family sugar-phosphate isomerase [Helicobacter enhydrae]ANV98162.1 hypothetical protein BBW65_04815 [Helicobacter enhydrae]